MRLKNVSTKKLLKTFQHKFTTKYELIKEHKLNDMKKGYKVIHTDIVLWAH